MSQAHSGVLNTSTIHVVDIDNIEFHQDERLAYINVYIKNDSDDTLNYLDSITGEVVIDLEDLKRIASKWYTDNILEMAYWKGKRQKGGLKKMSNIKITLKVMNVNTKVLNIPSHLSKTLSEKFSCFTPNYWFSSQYKNGYWDGKLRFYNASTNTFPTGLLPKVIAYLKELDIAYQLQDCRTNSTISLDKILLSELNLNEKSLREYQLDAVNSVALNSVDSLDFQRGIINIATNGGKCQDPESLVLTSKGFRKIKDLKVGDQIYGEDGELHTVLGVFFHDKKEMYAVTFNDGSSCICSSDHLWTVQNSLTKKWSTIELKTLMQDLSLHKTSPSLKFYIPNVEPINLPKRTLKVHPWLLGAILSHGYVGVHNIKYSSKNMDLILKAQQLVNAMGDTTTIQHRPKRNSHILVIKGQNLKLALQHYGLIKSSLVTSKFIPEDYLLSSIEDRILLLQGINDTTGYINTQRHTIEVITSSPRFLENLRDLVTSLGGSTRTCKHQTKTPVQHYKLIEHFAREEWLTQDHIGDNSIHPVSLHSKYTPGERIHKRYFKSIDYLKTGQAVCIYVDNPSHLYITNHFIVTHNTVIAESIMQGVLEKIPKGSTFLFLTHSKEIALQTKQSIEDNLNLTAGLVGAGKWDIQPITIALIPTLYSKFKKKDPQFQHLAEHVVGFIGDECHHSSSNSWLDVMNSFENAYIRLGLTGTVADENKKDSIDTVLKTTKLFSVTGDILSKISNDYLIQNGYSAKPICRIVPICYPDLDNTLANGQKLSYALEYQKGITTNGYRNYAISELCAREVKEDHQVLVLVEHLEHGANILDILEKEHPEISYIFLHGELSLDERQEGLNLLKSQSVNVVVATSILDEGVDVASISSIIYARGMKSSRKILQGIGRGLRKKQGTQQEVIVYDFLDETSARLLQHSIDRYNVLKKEKFKIKKFDMTVDFDYCLETYDTTYDEIFTKLQ